VENEKLKSKKDLLESKVASFEVLQQAIQKDVEELKRILNVKASKN
jgi:chaperonin cofactor prefoldin